MDRDLAVNRFYQLGFFLFPVLGATVKDAGSIILALLVIVGLVFGWRGWGGLLREEKIVFLGFGIFFLTSALALMATDDWNSALKRLDRLLRFLLILPVYLTIKRFNIDVSRWFLQGIIVSGIVLGTFTATKIFLLGNSTIDGPYNPGFVGLYAAISSSLLLALLVSTRVSTKYNFLILISLGMSIVALVLSMYRTGWIALVCAVVFFAIVYLIKGNGKKLASMFLVFVITAVFLYQLPAVHDRIQSGIAQIRNYSSEPEKISSVSDRINIWRNMLTLVSESPLIGAGLGDYYYESENLLNQGRSYSRNLHRSAHSVYFESLGTTGIIGFIAMVAGLFIIPVSSFYRMVRKSDSEVKNMLGHSGIVVVSIFAIAGLTGTWFGFNPLLNAYLFSVIACLSAVTSKDELGYISFKYWHRQS